MIKRTLYFGNPAHLSTKNQQLIVDLLGKECKGNSINVPIEDIGVLLLDNQQITITQRVMQLLLDNNCIIIVCDEKHMPQGMLNSIDGNTTQSERYKNQIESSLPLKKQLWQQTIIAKIKNQAALLKQQDVEIKNMIHWAKEVKSGDEKNHEARAAAYYWDNIFNKCFKRDRYGLSPNNLLNYGYAVLRAVIARALVGSGLILTLGIHHQNKYNSFCLADDIMEPYRPFVDKIVLNMILNNDSDDDIELTPDIKKQLLVIPAMDVIIGGQKSPLMLAAQRTSASLAKCFGGEMKKLLYPEMTI